MANLHSPFFTLHVAIVGALLIGCDGDAHTATTCSDEPVDLEALTRIERLPFLRPSAHARAFTSGDRVQASGNMDWNQYVSSRDGENTLFEARGPGVVTRFWRAHQPTPGGEHRFYFDDEPVPSLVLKTDELWSGTTPPFTYPLTLDSSQSSGGDLTYLPIAFSRSLRITDVLPPEKDYYQVDYLMLPEQTVVSGVMSGPIVQKAEDILRHVGANPNRSGRDDVPAEGTIETIPAGGLATVLSLLGPAQIVELVLEIDDSSASRTAFEQARLLITWDEASEPAVDAPLAMFFAHGSGIGPALRTLLVGNGPEGGRDTQFYAYFPMPFARSAELAIRAGDAPVDNLRYRIVHRPFPENIERAGYFHARHSIVAPKTVTDVVTLSGMAGHFVGLVFVPNANADLEGDPNLYVDGMITPISTGTGSEDYFNGGWYYDHGSFSTPLHGAMLAGEAPDGSKRGTQYRFQPNGLIPFSTDFRLTWEMAIGAQAVSYYYARPTPLRRETDSLDVGSADDELKHQYANTGTVTSVALSAEIAGASVSDSGRSLARGATTTFVVDVAPDNVGVALRRRFDVRAGTQRARVSVQDSVVGVWESHQLGAEDAPWAEDEFYIPRAASAGMSSLTVSLTVESDTWTEYGYRTSSQQRLSRDCP